MGSGPPGCGHQGLHHPRMQLCHLVNVQPLQRRHARTPAALTCTAAGRHERVPAQVLREALHFLKFAYAVSGWAGAKCRLLHGGCVQSACFLDFLYGEGRRKDVGSASGALPLQARPTDCTAPSHHSRSRKRLPACHRWRRPTPAPQVYALEPKIEAPASLLDLVCCCACATSPVDPQKVRKGAGRWRVAAPGRACGWAALCAEQGRHSARR